MPPFGRTVLCMHVWTTTEGLLQASREARKGAPQIQYLPIDELAEIIYFTTVLCVHLNLLWAGLCKKLTYLRSYHYLYILTPFKLLLSLRLDKQQFDKEWVRGRLILPKKTVYFLLLGRPFTFYGTSKKRAHSFIHNIYRHENDRASRGGECGKASRNR